MSLYPGQVTVQPHAYTDGHYLVVTPPAAADSSFRIVFKTDGQKVLRYTSGLVPAVEYVEGCSEKTRLRLPKRGGPLSSACRFLRSPQLFCVSCYPCQTFPATRSRKTAKPLLSCTGESSCASFAPTQAPKKRPSAIHNAAPMLRLPLR